MSVRADRVYGSESARRALAKLRESRASEAASILRRIDYLEQRLLEDCQAGEVIPFPLPRTAAALQRIHMTFTNLYCCDLPDFWRFLYTIVREKGIRVVYVLEIVDHAAYDKWFPGRKRR